MPARLIEDVFNQPELLTGYFDACILDQSGLHVQALQGVVNALAELPADRFNAQHHAIFVQLLTHPAWGGKGLAYNHSAERAGKPIRPLADLKEAWFLQLQQQYMGGGGQFLAGSRALFGQSLLVQACCKSMKKTVLTLRQAGRPYALISSEAREFLSSPEALGLEKNGNRQQAGYIFADGSLVIEHKDDRAPRIFDRFIISASTSAVGNQLMTRWKLFGQYVFGLPEQASAHCELLLNDTMRVQIPMSLVARAQELGLAKGFYYGADWMETWALN
ncbi:MAG: hypothetical protein RL497_1058 [Pseudomonadota bacterium]|jgi:hypothetical protein